MNETRFVNFFPTGDRHDYKDNRYQQLISEGRKPIGFDLRVDDFVGRCSVSGACRSNGRLLSTRHGRLFVLPRRSAVGHEYAFPPHRPNAGYGFRKETIAGMRRNGREAPIADPPAVASEREVRVKAVVRLGQDIGRPCRVGPGNCTPSLSQIRTFDHLTQDRLAVKNRVLKFDHAQSGYLHPGPPEGRHCRLSPRSVRDCAKPAMSTDKT
jgi:hypothetical protein